MQLARGADEPACQPDLLLRLVLDVRTAPVLNVLPGRARLVNRLERGHGVCRAESARLLLGGHAREARLEHVGREGVHLVVVLAHVPVRVHPRQHTGGLRQVLQQQRALVPVVRRDVQVPDVHAPGVAAAFAQRCGVRRRDARDGFLQHHVGARERVLLREGLRGGIEREPWLVAALRGGDRRTRARHRPGAPSALSTVSEGKTPRSRRKRRANGYRPRPERCDPYRHSVCGLFVFQA